MTIKISKTLGMFSQHGSLGSLGVSMGNFGRGRMPRHFRNPNMSSANFVFSVIKLFVNFNKKSLIRKFFFSI